MIVLGRQREVALPPMLLFRIQGLRLAVPTAAVRRIHRDVVLHEVPRPRPGIHGFIEESGELLPVLALGGEDVRAGTYLMTLTAGSRSLAIPAEEVDGVEQPAAESIARAPAGSPLPARGALLLREEMFLILDLQRLADAVLSAPTSTQQGGEQP